MPRPRREDCDALITPAQAELIVAWQWLALRLARRSVLYRLDPDEALDVATWALVGAARTYRADQGTHFGSWAYLKVRGALLDAWRSRRRTEPLEADPPDRDHDHDQAEDLDDLLRLAPTDRHRQVLALRYRDGLRQREIAAAIGLGQSGVSRLLAEGHQAIRGALAEVKG